MSNLFLELKYARMLGSSIERWKVKGNSPFHGNGRCHICGDSLKSKTLCRFHVREYSGACFVSCFNCGYSSNLAGYLKTYQPSLYSEFAFEKYRINEDDKPIIKSVITIDDSDLIPPKKPSKALKLLDLPLVSDMDADSLVARYVDSRMLPAYPFQYAENFYQFSSQFNQELSCFKRDESRLIIPFFDRLGNVFAYQGRDLLGKSHQKYITITVNPKVPKIFGIDRVDFNKPITIVEGPIDSLFLNNCLASVNASLVATANKLSSVVKKENMTLVFDNEPRNVVILKMYSAALADGYKVCIWPKECQNKKDINQMVLEGISPLKISEIIEKNSFSNLMGQIKFSDWRCS
jgi:hypothetical protein